MKSPVGFGESLVVWKFIQRLPVDRPPDLRFRFQVREQTFTHQTHLRVWPRPTSELDLNKHSNVKHHMNIHQICSDLLLLEWTRWAETHIRFTLKQKHDEPANEPERLICYFLQLWFCVFGCFLCLCGPFVCLSLCCCLSLSHDVVIMLHLLFLVLLKRIFFLSTNVHVEVLLMHLQSPAVSSSVDINQAAGCSCSNTHYMYMWRWFDGARTRR